jgi:hypothetical protein
MTRLLLDFTNQVSSISGANLNDAGLNENTHVFWIKAATYRNYKNGAMECNFLEKKSGRICRIILFRIAFRNRLPSRLWRHFEAIVMKSTTKMKISSHTQIFFYRLDQENMLEKIVNLAGCKWLPYRTVRQATIPYQACSSNRRIVQCGYQSHMALFPLLKITE